MRSPAIRRHHRTRSLGSVVILALLATVGGILVPTTASAAGTVLFQNLFNDRTVDGTGTVTVPATAGGATNTACLTALGNFSTQPLLSCSGATDLQGSGKLRLTPATINQVGGVMGASSFPTSNGLDVTFNSYQWGGNNADGIAFMLAAVDPANPAVATTIGPSGGALGYATAPGVNGLANAYLGVGLDVFGNFSSTQYVGTGCTSPANFGTTIAGTVVVRGPGNARAGYCGLATTYDGTAGSKATLRAATRSASVVPVQVLINPTSSSFTSDSGVSVAAGTYKVVVTPVGQAAKTLTGPLPAVTAGLYPSATWTNAGGVPKQLAFGFVGSTGSVTDVHEISNVKVLTFNPVPQLAVSTVSYAASTSQPGDPVTYTVTPSVQAGANETAAVSVTQTVPAGVIPVGAYGTGWVCQAAVDQTITCTTTATSFTNGTTLPQLTVVGIVTAGGVTSATIQGGSPTTASSADGNPATDSATTLGTRPAAPSGVTATPAIGPIAGGGSVTIGGTSTVGPTAIEIGTTAEQQAGTPVVILPCPGAAAVGCFTIVGSTVVISSMPARAAAASVSITMVTLGIASAVGYVYADKPAVPAAPTATAGITSATVTWVAPAANGSPLTGYVVTPYLANVAQAPHSFDLSTTTRTISSLTAGGSYTFTVAATNAYGTSTSAKSVVVVPYALPGTPSITAANAGDSSATLTWTAPSANGSTITGYVVIPYIGAVAQPAQTFGAATTQIVVGLTPGTSYRFTVAAQNAAGTGPASALSTAVIPNVSPSLAFPAPPSGEVGVAYSSQLTVTDGTSPFAWTVSAGALPAGVTLNASTGLLSGTPTTAGTASFTVRVTDASNLTATRAVSIAVAAAPSVAFTPAGGQVGVAYSQQPTLSGGTGPFAWAVSAGALPPGLTLNASTGLVSGTPTAGGGFSVTVRVTDGFAQVASRTVTITIVASPAFVAGAPPSGQVGVPYSTTFQVTGGTSPIVLSISAGSLPSGLTFNAGSGAVSGTPTTVGTSSFTVSAIDANGQTATKPVTLVIAAGPLVIVKTANVSSAPAGSGVAYTITITNTGSSSFTGVSLSDPLTAVLDDAAYNANAAASSGSVAYTAPNLTWTGNVGPSAVVTITYSVTVNNPDAGNKVLSNTVTSTTLGTNCAGGSGDTRCSSTVTVPGLTIVKTANVSTTTPGGTVTFTIVVTNTGPTAFIGATLTDGLAGLLDDAAYNADAEATSGNLSYTSPGLTWTGSLAIGASATITYTATVANPDNGNRSLTGTVVSASAGSPCPSSGPAPQCTATVTVLVPALAITTSAGVATTTPGATVTYTWSLSNTGQTAYTGITARLSLAAVLDDATYAGGAAATSGSVTLDTATSSLVWSGNLAIGAVATITAPVIVRSPDPGDKTLTTVATSSAAGSSCPVGGSSPTCTTTVQVRVPELTITSSASLSTTTPGSVVGQTVSVTNTGQTSYAAAAFSVALAGVLDDAVYNGDASATSGTVSFSSATLSWVGGLALGATATITFSVTVRDPDLGNRTLGSLVTSATAGSNCATGSSDPRCATSVAVLIPGLSITMEGDSVTTTPGAVVHYTLTATNTGETPYDALAITLDLLEALDDADYNYDAAISRGALVTNPDATVDWVLALAPGESATGTISVTVKDPDTGDRSLHVDAVSNAAGSPCPTGVPAASCHSEITVLVPGLTITKAASRSTVTPGGTVGYTITVLNSGETPYTAASVSDDLEQVLTDATYAGDATATTGTVSYDAPTLSWVGALAPGASATVTYEVMVRDPDPGDKVMTNTAVSSAAGSNCLPGSTDPRCRSTVNVLVPGLTIVKTADRSTSAPGESVAYSVVVTNSGATPQIGAAFSDSLAGVLDDAALSAGPTVTSGTVGVAGSSLTWTGNLAVGASATVTYTVIVHAADVGDDVLVGSVTSSTTGSSCLPSGSDPRCTVAVPVARLVILNSVDRVATPGEVVNVTGSFTNTGQVPFVGISVFAYSNDASDDTLPGGDQTVSSGSLALSGSGLTWTGDIPVGGVVSLDATLTIQDPDLGDGHFTAISESQAPGSNCPPGSADPRCTFQLTVVTPQLTISKSASTTATVPGGSVGYTITVHNTGQTAYTGAVATDSMVGLLDDATYDGNASATAGVVSTTATTVSWTGDLAIGATATITYSVTARSPATGDKTMVNLVTSTEVGSTCPPGGGAAPCRTTVVVLTPGLTILKTASLPNATLGTSVAYTVKVTNSGQTSQPAAAFTDSLAGVLDDATYGGNASATSGTVGYASGVLSWSGALAPGASATVTYSASINNPDAGDHSLANTVVSSTTGNNCRSTSTDPRCTVVVPVTDSVSLTITKTAGAPSAVAGGVVAYTVTIANSSGSDITGADLTDPLAGILDDATYNGDAAASAGAVTYAAPVLSWTGTVPTLGTVTLTYSVTVRGTLAGDERMVGTVSSSSLPSSNSCSPGSTDPRCSSTVTVSALGLQQHYTETTTTPGSLVHLSATFTNLGQTPYNGISVSSLSADTVDDAVPTGDQTATAGTLVLSATAITWTGDLAVGATVTVTGTLTVKNPDPGNLLLAGSLVSAAPGGNCPSGSTDPSCRALLPVLLPGLTISKSASTPATAPGGQVGYTITIANSGQTAYSSAVVTDSLAGLLDDAGYDGNGSATIGEVTFAASTLSWTGDLAVGETSTVTYSVTADNPAGGDKTLVNRVASTAVGSTCPPATGNAACRTAGIVLTPALTITSAADATSAVPGQSVTYTLTATNTGQIPATPATVSVALGGVLDDAAYAGGASATSGTVTVAAGTLTWSGNLYPGYPGATITYTVVVAQPVLGDFRLAQTVVSTDPGSSCLPGGSDARCSTSVPIASLRILTTTDVATAKPTSVVQSTVTITNAGQVPYVGISVNDSFVGSLDDATYNGDAATTAGSLILEAATGSVTWTGDLAVGATVTLTGSLTVNNPDLGNKLMTTLVSTAAPASTCPVGGTDPACRTSVVVKIPGLTITKAASASATTPGSPVEYTITATNTGETPYTAATLSDSLSGVLADATYQGDATASRGALAYADPTLTWTGDLAVGQTVVIAYSVEVNDPDLGGRVMVNGVRSDELGSTCAEGSPSPSCATVVAVLVPVLDIAVVADRSTAVPGDSVGHTVTVRNTGQTPFQSATVTVSLAGALDDAAYGGGATATTGGLAYSAPSLTWTGDLPIGATATITYAVAVDDPDLGDRQLSSTVASSAPGSTCGSAPQCAVVVAVLVPGLAVSTSADVATATPGDPVTYTITLTNTGETDYPAAAFSTDLTDVVDDATFSGAATSSIGVATYSAPELSWIGDLHVGDTATITYTVTIRDPDTGDRTLTSRLVVPSQGSTCRATSTDPSCTVAVSVLIPELTITKTASSATTTPGAVVGYTIVVSNSGETAYTAAVVRDSLLGVLPDSTYDANAVVVGGGTLGYADSTVTWTGDLLVGASATITYSITVDDPDPGDKAMTNTVTSSAPGSTCPPGPAVAPCTTLVRVLVPGLSVTKVADAPEVTAGGVVLYTVTLVNDGETDYLPATFTDPLVDVLDDAGYAGDAAASAGAVDYVNGTLVWSGPLEVGASITVTYSVAPTFPALGDRVLTNTVHSPSAGATCGAGIDPGCQATVTVLVPALAITKTAAAGEVVAGGPLQYTISATNTGEADYPAASLTDSLAGVLDDGAYNGDATATMGTVAYDEGALTWTGELARQASVTVTYSVSADLVDVGDAVLVNRVTSGSVGSTCPVGGSDTGCSTSTPVAVRFITLTGLTPSFTLTGLPHTTVDSDGAVTMTVITNSSGGYQVAVKGTAPSLVGAEPGNTATIPLGNLGVRESGAALFQPVSPDEWTIVHGQDTASAAAGDAVSNDYQIDIPFVPPDSYSTTLEYVASAQ
jgi:uncharacterized repeat protein (TIGR01451 family)